MRPALDLPATRIASFLYVITAVTAISGFLYGYDSGILSATILPITSEFHLDHRMQEILASSILVGAVFGALGCGVLCEHIGRKYTLILVACIFSAGSCCSSIAPTPQLLMLSLLLLGLAIGGSAQVTPIYLAELAPPQGRGRMVVSFNLSIAAGFLIANIVAFALHDIWSWRSMIAVAAFPAILLLLSMFWMPESPRYLAASAFIDAARSVLERVRGNENEAESENEAEIEDELDAIRLVVRKGGCGANARWSLLAKPWIRPAAIAAFGVAAFSQLCGLGTILCYAPALFSGAGFGKSAAWFTGLGVSIVFVVMTAIGRHIVDRIGRRRLALVMIPGAVVSLLVLGILLRMGFAKTPQGSGILVVCLLFYVVFSAGGVQVIAWLLGAEMFPLAIRGKASGVYAAVMSGSSLIVTSTALSLASRLGMGGVMGVYAALNFLCFVFVWHFVPETTGHSLEAIENHLRAGNFMDLKIKRAED